MTHQASRPARIVIVGAGHVGATPAYSLVLDGLAPEIVLIDQDHRRAEEEAILRDQATVLSVSSLVPSHYGIGDVCLGVPTVVARNGIERVLHLPLDRERLRHFGSRVPSCGRPSRACTCRRHQGPMAEAVTREPSTRVNTSP